MDLGLFYGNIKHGKSLELKILWEVLKFFAQKCSNDDIGLTLTILRQDQICFPVFCTTEEFMELVEDMGSKV